MYQRLAPVRTLTCSHARCHVPPSPRLMQDLLQRYTELRAENRLPKSTTFKEFFDFWVSSRRGEDLIGLDDGRVEAGPHPGAKGGVQLIDRPPSRLKGVIQTVVLLVDFPDRPNAKEDRKSVV